MMEILVLEHEREAPAGLLATMLTIDRASVPKRANLNLRMRLSYSINWQVYNKRC